MKKCNDQTHYLVLFGVHGSSKGLLGNLDEELLESFASSIKLIQQKQSEIMQSKDLKLEGMKIQTKWDENGKLVLLNQDKIVKKSRSSNKLILCFKCQTRTAFLQRQELICYNQ